MTLGHVCQRLGGSIDKAFIEREVLLRTDGRVLYAYLSRRTQLVLSVSLGLGPYQEPKQDQSDDEFED